MHTTRGTTMADKSKRNIDPQVRVDRLREEHEQVVKGCDEQILHWKKVSGDYEALDDRLRTLPDHLSYDVMVPFGPLAFMPGKLVHTNEVTVLLGDNWFAKCSAKQAQKIVDHRVKYVKGELDDLLKTRKNFEARVGFTEDLKELSNKGSYVDIREEVRSRETVVTKGKQRVAHKPNSKPKLDTVLDLEEVEEEGKGVEADEEYCKILSEKELWARLDQLEKLEELQDEEDRLSDTGDTNGDNTTSSSSSEEEKEADCSQPEKEPGPKTSWATSGPANGQLVSQAAPGGDTTKDEDEQEEEEEDCLPTIYFSHTVEPKKVRICTGKNTTLKFSERKEHSLTHSKRKKKNNGTNGHSHHELHKITSPVDIYRLFVDVKNGEPVPRKSILKSRSRENSVCSDTSESSAADFDERRLVCRSVSHDDAPHSDTSDGHTEDDSPTPLPRTPSRFEAFSGTVVEKDPTPTAVPHLTIAPPALPTILERKQEEGTTDAAPPVEPPKRVSKFKAGRQNR
ncbi:unconventional prefoldin RPB5 interactor 1 [Gadus macrocephalus]|uniref:unconventional prefoldin RPB5 interactor 1 n=1 Tax=Gadus macrocephalus TaxID=80720 RepID=UPI0028CB73D0|nr:unconventional prefoldin RPB5 interactor 1 [Gadus macrocephalus]